MPSEFRNDPANLASTRDDCRRAALAARIARRYRTATETLRIGNLCLAFTRVVDLDQVLAEMEGPAAGVRAGWQPYWAEAWDSALAVAAVLAGEPLRDQQVLDLGCGLGLTGAVAAAGGAHVLLADAAPPALLFARLNCWPWRARVRLRRLDWRCDRLPGARFDRVVGSDILYDVEDWPPLERFWRAHLTARGELLLGEPGRSPGDAFPDWLRSRGWQVAISQATPPGARRAIRLFRATFALGSGTSQLQSSSPHDRPQSQARCDED